MSKARLDARIKKRKKKFYYKKNGDSQGYYKPSHLDYIKNFFCSVTFIEKPIHSRIKLFVSLIHASVILTTLMGFYVIYISILSYGISERTSRIDMAYDVNRPNILRVRAIQSLIREGVPVNNLSFLKFNKSPMVYNKVYFDFESEGNKLGGRYAYSVNGIAVSESSMDFYIKNTIFNDLKVRKSQVNFFGRNYTIEDGDFLNSIIDWVDFHFVNLSVICLNNSSLNFFDGDNLLISLSKVDKFSRFLKKPLIREECDNSSGSITLESTKNAQVKENLGADLSIINSRNIFIDLDSEINQAENISWKRQEKEHSLFIKDSTLVELNLYRSASIISIDSEMKVNGKVLEKIGYLPVFRFRSSHNNKSRGNYVKVLGRLGVLELDYYSSQENYKFINQNSHVAVLAIKRATVGSCDSISKIIEEFDMGKRVLFVESNPCDFGKKVSLSLYSKIIDDLEKLAKRENFGTKLFHEQLNELLF